MSGKLVLLLLAFSWACVAQDYDAPDAAAEARLLAGVDDIIKTLKELVIKLEQALSGLGNLLPNIDNKIKDITNGIDVPKILAEILERIEAIMIAAAVDENAATSCLKAEKEAVEKLPSTIANGITECTKLFDPIKSQIQQQGADIATDSNEIIHGIPQEITKCLKNWNPVKILKCLEGLLDHNTAKVNALLEKINQAIEDGQVLIEDTAAKLSTCVQEMAKYEKEAIIDQFQKCIDDIVK